MKRTYPSLSKSGVNEDILVDLVAKTEWDDIVIQSIEMNEVDFELIKTVDVPFCKSVYVSKTILGFPIQINNNLKEIVVTGRKITSHELKS